MDPLRAHALRYLAQRTTTKGHLERLLLRGALKREPDSRPDDHLPAIRALLDELAASGAIDDAAWTASKVASLRRRGTSPAGIRAKLAAKRAPREGVDAELAEGGPEADLVSALLHLRRRRLGPWAAEPDPERAVTRLGRAGFSFETARRAAFMALDDARALAGW